ncbi:MAG: HEAT repeat domain-containing protein [Pirellula sp.]
MNCRYWLRVGSICVFVAMGVWANASVAQEPTGELVRMVIELLQNSDKDMRAIALEQICYEAKGTGATTQFASQLPKLNSEAQIELLRALGTRADVSAKALVLSVLKSSGDTGVRAAAMGTLGELGDSTDLQLLMYALKDDSTDIQLAAKKSLTRLRPPNINSLLVDAMKNGDAVSQAAMIEVLVARRASEGMPQVAMAVMGREAKVRRAAMSALAELGSAKQIPEMIQGVLKAEKGAERDAAERAVVNLCNRIAKPESRADAVLVARSHLDDASQLDLLSVVAKIGGPKALETVESTMASANPAHHEFGLKAFCNWPDSAITDKLVKLIESTANAAERGLEFKALVRLASTRDRRNDVDRLARFKQAMTLVKSNEEQALVIDKCRSAYSVDTLRFVLPYVDQADFAEVACETIVELAHHREIREPNKAEFDKALDRVLQISKNSVIKDRAQRYKKGETWQRPRGN